MLNFILGASGSGKTDKLYEILQNEQNDRIILFVPEQSTFETEKLLFKKIGNKVKVTSLSRLCNDIFKQYGGIAGNYITDYAKIILMDMAIQKANLTIYEKSSKTKGFSSSMLNTITELKHANVTPEKLLSVDYKDEYLKSKIDEISQIYSIYENFIQQKYKDPLDNISVAINKIKDKGYFNGYTIAFDEFKGFTATEIQFIKLIMSEAKEVYFSLCYLPNRNIFDFTHQTYQRLKALAQTSNVKVSAPVILEGSKRFKNEALIHLEQNILSKNPQQYFGEDKNAVTAIYCKNEYKEVDTALSVIKELVIKNDYSYSDIAIVSRDMDTYTNKLITSAIKYNIPIYCDQRKLIEQKPIIKFISYALQSICNNFNSNDILNLLKCDLCGYSVTQISKFEKYIYIWNIKNINKKFTASVNGFSDKSDEDELCELEQMRINIIEKLKQLKSTEGTGKSISFGILSLMQTFNVKEQTQQIILDLKNKQQYDLAQEYVNIYDAFVKIIDTLALTLDQEKTDFKRYLKLFTLIAQTYDMGKLPQSLDCVIAGSADRIRVKDKKAIIVLGSSTLPLIPKETGVFTDNERTFLIENEIEISPPINQKIKEERFIAYKTLTLPSHFLILTARYSDISGKEIANPIIFSQIKQMFSTVLEDISTEFYLKTKASTFPYLAKEIGNEDKVNFNHTLKIALGEDYKYKIKKLEALQKNQEYSLSFDFFDDRLNLSPTSIEQYYKCPFQFFCDKGLNIKPLDKCELNPLEAGSLIHNALYDILKSGVLFEENYNQPKINQVIKNSLDDYIEKYMGGKEDKTDRFLYSYFRKEKTLLDISKHIFNEFKQSEFVATDLEYPITENSQEITPLIMEFDNNKSVCVTGKVDRIDLYQNENGDKYVRVIDYKTGKKEFKLGEVLYGMNLQMLLYLFMIEDNGKGKYNNCNSAGILYYPASNLTADLGRNATTDEILKIQDEFYCTNGLLLDNPKVLKAMESSSNGYYIPEKTDKKTKSFIDQKQFADISLYTKLKVKQMAQNLFMGKIPANSITCKYCNYKSVCTSKDKTDADFKALIDKKEDVLEAIRKEVEEDD